LNTNKHIILYTDSLITKIPYKDYGSIKTAMKKMKGCFRKRYRICHSCLVQYVTEGEGKRAIEKLSSSLRSS